MFLLIFILYSDFIFILIQYKLSLLKPSVNSFSCTPCFLVLLFSHSYELSWIITCFASLSALVFCNRLNCLRSCFKLPIRNNQLLLFTMCIVSCVNFIFLFENHYHYIEDTAKIVKSMSKKGSFMFTNNAFCINNKSLSPSE